jgi:NRPS condensation-like uncharacterized protein
MISQSADVSGRLNTFQRVMLQWSEVHPYNASHVYYLAGPLRLDALREAIREAYALNGLGIAEVSKGLHTYHFETDQDEPAIEVLRAEDGQPENLATHLTRQLNCPFARPRCQPVRFSVTADSAQSHLIVATYDHWIADSVGARLILRHVLGRYLGLEIPENEQPLRRYPGTYREVFADQWGVRRIAGAAAKSVGRWVNNQLGCRVARLYAPEMEVGLVLARTSPGQVSRVLQFARSLEVTVHDVILAATARALTRELPEDLFRRRPELAIGSIVSTRQDAKQDLSETLGVFLGFLLTRCRADRQIGLRELAKQIGAANRSLKAAHSYVDSLMNLKLFGTLWPILDSWNRRELVRKGMPMTAGISNVRIKDTWLDRYGAGQILDYFRAAPAGPMLPLVFAPTTFGDQMTLSVTYRAACFSRSQIEAILALILAQLEQPDAAG